MVKGQEQSAAPGRAPESGHLPVVRNYLWRALCLGALWGNLLYVGSFLVTIGVLVGLGPAPWQAYANVLLILAVTAGTPLLNVKAARAGLTATCSGVAFVLNLLCLAYFVFKPEYSVFALKLLVVAVPLLNVIVVVSGWSRRVASAHRAYRRDA
jgi:hypothetical protein